MEELRPSERVYRTSELFQSILDFLGNDGIARMSPLCRDFQPWVGKHLYRHLRLASFDNMLRKHKFWTDEYCAQVLYVDANQMDSHLRGRYHCISVVPTSHYILSGPALRYIQQKCPSLLLIYQTHNYWEHQDKWQVQFEFRGRITLFQTRDAQFWLDREIVKGSVVKEDPRPERDMTGIDMVVTLGISDGYMDTRTWPRKTIPDGMDRYRDWLIKADDFPSNVIRLHLLDMPISLGQVTEMCVNRVKHGRRHMEEIGVDSMHPFDLASLEHFLDKTGQRLRILILSHIQDQQPQPPLLHLNQLSQVVDLIKQKCPVLQRLELYFSGPPAGGVTLDEAIPVSASPYDGELSFVGFHLHDEHVREYLGDTPLFAIARNMACLGGRQCYCETSLIDSDEQYGTSVNGNSEQLAPLIEYLRQLSPHVAAHVRSANFKDLDLSGPKWKELLDLECESDGRPIKRSISQLRECYVTALVAVEISKRSIARLQQHWNDYGISSRRGANMVQTMKREGRTQLENVTNNLVRLDQNFAQFGIATDFEGRDTKFAAETEATWAAYISLPPPEPRSSELTFFGSILPGWPGSETWPPSFLDDEGKPQFRSRRLEFQYEHGMFPEAVEGLDFGALKGWEIEPDENDHYMTRIRKWGTWS